MPEWTPGPWKKHTTGYTVYGYEEKAVWVQVAACATRDLSPNRTEANARLIAHAPELYEVVEEMLPWCGAGTSGAQAILALAARSKAQSILARARGEETP